ncbi:acetyl-CoA carboxylase biotin carboxyl carrier protein subunit [Flagellimonas sp. S3867]|uniref:acetyl-CoA carboxylase biotin carboxyl carrier protein subunit n=1 Tax=Flagellimonas sp. S3867 TaxID=2768063 RepID=UPI001CC26A16|nr:acetyl-CoA carboxylase biotin carboxyl carrier protein subunit [Flagellimonas sp. S3867]
MGTVFMEKSHMIKVDGDFDFQLSEEDISELDILKTGNNTYHILKNGAAFKIEITVSDYPNGLYSVKVNGSEYQTSIGTPLDELIKKMGFASNGSKNINSISAPMPGLILSISVEEGQEVEEDQQLLVLEAMKMENIITSPRKGVVKKVAVKQGDAVDKQQLLIEFQ